MDSNLLMDVLLARVLRTTSRSESSNLLFNRFIHRKLSFVEFWLRFDTALEYQRQEELKVDYISVHGTPTLSTPWLVEKQGSIIYTHEVFKNFKVEVVVARDHCSVVGITQVESGNFVGINDAFEQRDRVVHWCTLSNFGTCSCKLFEKIGIPCHHIILTLQSEKIYELSLPYVLKK
jgi:hypothetical protein